MTDSPCVKRCRPDWEQQLCEACGRTLDEIARWTRMSQEERQVILERIRKDKK